MRTILVASLLILLAAVACGSEAPDPVVTAEPTVGSTPSATGAPATPKPTVTVAATPSPTDTPVPSPTVEPTPTSTPTDTAQDPDRAALLKEIDQLWGDAMVKREWAFVHAFFPDEFRAKCSLGDFAALMTFGWAFLGIPEDSSYVLDGVRIDGDNGWIDSHLEKDGVSFDLDDDEGVTDEEPEWVWQDSKWVVYVSPEDLAEENPCSLDFTAEDTPTTPITPTPRASPTPPIIPTPRATPTPRPPGYSLNNPVEAGGILQGSDGTEISVLAIIADARQQIAEENMFNDPPEEGNRFYMIRVDIVYPSGDESISVREADFRLIGDNRLIYAPFDQTCGLIPDELGGEIFGGGRIEGNICFEIPEDEGGLILIHEPGFGSESRRFLSLEE